MTKTLTISNEQLNQIYNITDNSEGVESSENVTLKEFLMDIFDDDETEMDLDTIENFEIEDEDGFYSDLINLNIDSSMVDSLDSTITYTRLC